MVETLIIIAILEIGALSFLGWRFLSSNFDKLYVKLAEIEARDVETVKNLERIGDNLNYKKEMQKVLDKLLDQAGISPLYADPPPPQEPTFPKSNLQRIAEEVSERQ